MRERDPRQNSPAEIYTLFRIARQTSRISPQFTAKYPLPPKSEIESLIGPQDLPFVHALIGAYPVPDVGDIRLRIGEPTVAQLCQSAEQRLVNAVTTGAIRVGIDPQTKEPKFIIKYIGKLVALCIGDHALPNGQVARQDHWYMPVDGRTTMGLEYDFRSEGPAQFEFNQGVWALMRPLELDNLKTISKMRFGDPIADFKSIMASEQFKQLSNRTQLPKTLVDLHGKSLRPEDFRAQAENFESIYEDTSLVDEAHRDVIASD